jgi:hypothetical protein
MKLSELRQIGNTPTDTVVGFVVRAETETAARMVAREYAGGEGVSEPPSPDVGSSTRGLGRALGWSLPFT